MITKGLDEYEITFELANGGKVNQEQFVKYFMADWGNFKLPKQEKLNPDNIEKVIFNPPATIVFFKDGTKEVVKAHNEDFDPEKGVAMAMISLIWGNKSEFKRFIKKYEEESFKNKK